MRNSFIVNVYIKCPDGRTLAHDSEICVRSVQQLAPYDVCDDPFTAYVTKAISPIDAMKIDAERKRFCDKLAADISAQVVSAISDGDTVDGYKKGER